ncbi:MAG: methyltransferase domain-containing protein, partial [Acidimicrobiales bacterium]|nr:methyltransferase domain-containing protein [Acidimicrobiales bacterium]
MSPSDGQRAGDRRWRDGSEDAVIEILREATDCSSASDELAAHISNWPTQYHFGRARTNLLQPLDLTAAPRVLDVGAGTGVMSRFVAERGASVVAIEGDARRAEAAALRCVGLDVDVRHGSIDKVDAADGPFDVVLCIGVLEYAGDDPGGFLGQLAAHLMPDGVLVVAIENRFGLTYWLGGHEDHLGRPWVGLEGYPKSMATPETVTVRTHGRRELAGLLTSVGLGVQRWLAPWPDYKLPTAILADIAASAAKGSGHNLEGMYFAARAFIDKLGVTIGIMVFASLTNFGKDPGDDLGIRLSGPAGGVTAIIAALLFLRYDEEAVLRGNAEEEAMQSPRGVEMSPAAQQGGGAPVTTAAVVVTNAAAAGAGAAADGSGRAASPPPWHPISAKGGGKAAVP